MNYEQAVPIIENILDDKQVEHYPSYDNTPTWSNDYCEWTLYTSHLGVLKFECQNIEIVRETFYDIPVTDNFKQILELLENN